jgi:hypothetical protein
MPRPKLKYYYYAMSQQDYDSFARTRQLEVSDRVTIDINTGTVTGRTLLMLTAGVTLADQLFRAAHHWSAPVYVLRIPRHCIDQALLEQTEPNVYCYRGGLHIDHCGVERVELAP